MAIDHRCFGVPLSCFEKYVISLSRRFCLWDPSRHSASLIALFQEQQYSVSVDYLSAPNSSLAEILALNWQNFQELQATVLKDNPFCLCGRSAGGYLMLALTQQLLKEQQRLPEKLVNFYGYTDLSLLKTNESCSSRS